MDLTRTAYGTWSGGRFMHFGEPLEEDRFHAAVRLAYDSGIRTFITADVYGNGAADSVLGRALSGIPRETYALVGMIGHDFYHGERAGSKGYPRFTDALLRHPRDFASYVRMATEKSLERCRVDKFDLLMLHNPDFLGYTNDAVWNAMEKVKDAQLTDRLGVAPGPANGFTLDVILCFERFGPLLDWAMLILNPLEPWPGQLALPAAREHKVDVLTRVVDYGGLFHGDVRPGHVFPKYDHRTFRPAGWVERGAAKIDKMLPIAEKNGLTPLQLSCIWDLSQEPVKCVAPTLIQEGHSEAKSYEEKIAELASLPSITLTAEEVEELGRIGANVGCMDLKGSNPAHLGETLPDRWAITPDLLSVANRWNIVPERDIAMTHPVS